VTFLEKKVGEVKDEHKKTLLTISKVSEEQKYFVKTIKETIEQRHNKASNEAKTA
jgi:hypothetical protein